MPLGMTMSFIHRGGSAMASYRYRAQMPAKSLNSYLNKIPADVLVFAKPLPGDLEIARSQKDRGSKIVVDICDDHLSNPLYQDMLELADLVTVPTSTMGELIGRETAIVPDSYEFEERAPHCQGKNLLWFGHSSNYASLQRLDLDDPIAVVSNISGATPWSMDTLRRAFKKADIVVMPATASYKSPNRTLEAIRQGCFVVAEPHPALLDFPIWIGDIKEGIEWASTHLIEANQMIAKAQDFIRRRYSPKIQENAWRTALQALG